MELLQDDVFDDKMIQNPFEQAMEKSMKMSSPTQLTPHPSKGYLKGFFPPSEDQNVQIDISPSSMSQSVESIHFSKETTPAFEYKEPLLSELDEAIERFRFVSLGLDNQMIKNYLFTCFIKNLLN